MADTYVVVLLHTTWDVPGATTQAPCELLLLSWCSVDAALLHVSPVSLLTTENGFGDLVAALDRDLAAQSFVFVTVDTQHLRVLLPREARDRGVPLPAYLQHPRVFDLVNEYAKWQRHHPEAMGYPPTSVANAAAALGVACDGLCRGVAELLAELVRQLPCETHGDVLVRPYDTAQDAKVFLAERLKVLHLGNLPPDTTLLELEQWFALFGLRPVALWALRHDDKARRSCGFAVFGKHEEAAQLLRANGHHLHDRAVEVLPSSARVLDHAAELLAPFAPQKNRPRPGDWTCPLCGFSNFQRRIACFRCSFPATSAVAVHEQMHPRKDDKYDYKYYQRLHFGQSVPFRAGDWKCTNDSCQYHNFAKNVQCLKCGGARPQGAPQAQPDYRSYPRKYDRRSPPYYDLGVGVLEQMNSLSLNGV